MQQAIILPAGACSPAPPRPAQVTIPLPVPGQLPLSVSLLTLHKKDLTLLQAAAKLGPLLAEEAAKLVAAQQGAAVPGSGSSAAASSGSGGSKGERPKGRKKGRAGADPEAKARAEACKELGNTAFKAGRYELRGSACGASSALRLRL